MSSGVSPMGGNTPPPETAEEKAARLQREAEAMRRKLQTIALIPLFLGSFSAQYPLAAVLVDIVQGSASLDKRYFIAVALNNLMVDREIQNPEVQARVVGIFARNAKDPQSDLYRALNHQKNYLFPMSFGGAMTPIAWNYAHSLQRVHKVIEEEEARSAAPQH